MLQPKMLEAIARNDPEKIRHQEVEERMRSAQRGTNQVAVRSYNERLLLQLVRRHGEMTKAEATRASGLSANATSVIFRSLEERELVVRSDRILGRIGQPSTPMRINPDAHRYVSLKIGRRSVELAVINFVGEMLAHRRETYGYPTPAKVMDFVGRMLTPVLRSARTARRKVTAMAVAMPFELWSWTDEFGAPREELRAWQKFNVAASLGEVVPWSVVVENDGTAACRAEQIFGEHSDKQDWIYFFLGTFIGGGIVLNGSVFPGRRGNAGGFGPMRVPDMAGGDRLVDHASLIVLERSLASAGIDPAMIYEEETDWTEFGEHLEQWFQRASRSLSFAVVSSLSVLDFDAVVIDGAAPQMVKDRLVAGVIDQLKVTDLQGVLCPAVEAGQIGRDARLIGAAGALINQDYLLDQHTLMRI